MRLLQGPIELENGVNLNSAVLYVETISDHNLSQISTNQDWQRDIQTGDEFVIRSHAVTRQERDCAYSVAVWGSVENFKSGRPMICYIPDGMSQSLRMTPPAEAAGMELLQCAIDDLISRFPGLVEIEV